jgi:hypothetical protein
VYEPEIIEDLATRNWHSSSNKKSGKPGKVSANAEIIAEGAPERFAKILRRLDESTPPKEHAGGTAPS